MSERVGKRESGFDPGLYFEITPTKPEAPKPQKPLGDKEAIEAALHRQGGAAYVNRPRGQTSKEAIEQALRDQGAGEYVDGPRLKTGEAVLVEAFSRKQNPLTPRCAMPRQAPVETGTGTWGNVAKQNALGIQFTKLEEKHDKHTGRLESSIREWQAAKTKIASEEKDPAARKQKLAYADAAIGRLRTEFRESRIQFGIVAHEYKVALGQEKRVAVGPAKPGDKMLSPTELKDLQKRTITFQKRIDTVASSGLIAPIGVFLYVALTEASGRSLDARDYRALDTMYAIGALGDSAAPHVDSQHRDAGLKLEESIPYDARRAQELRSR